MGELAIAGFAVRITFDRWRHMFEAEVVMEASVEWLCYSFSSLDYHTVLCFALNDVLPDYLTEDIYETFSVIFLSSISR